MTRRLCFAALVAACAPGAAYDNLSSGARADGGPTEEAPLADDSAVLPPRPLSPLSVATVATRRPRFAWVLDASATGAFVEVSSSHDFSAADTKRFSAPRATELVVPEDLAPGIWFWRLRGRTDTTQGTALGPIWEVLVRGAAAKGQSDTPAGMIVDYDFDGEPDVIAAGEDGTMSGLAWARGAANAPLGPLTMFTHDIDPRFTARTGPVGLGAADIDADGAIDFVHAGLVGSGTSALPFVVVNDHDKTAKTSTWQILEVSVAPGIPPTVSAGGDVDGDGYGDFVVGHADGSSVAFGGPNRGAVPPLVALLDARSAPGVSRLALGNFDANDDGTSDVFAAIPAAGTAPNALFSGDRTRKLATSQGLLPSSVTTALASGDFDGDGLADVVGVSGNAVCFWKATPKQGLAFASCSTASADGKLGAVIAVDLEGDGTDDVVATLRLDDQTHQLRTFRLTAAGVDAGPTPVSPAGFMPMLTTIWPGRPGPGRWATLADGGASIAVFEGTTLRQTLACAPLHCRGLR
jgi:hypothetical protein